MWKTAAVTSHEIQFHAVEPVMDDDTRNIRNGFEIRRRRKRKAKICFPSSLLARKSNL